MAPDEETGRLTRFPSANPDGLIGIAHNGRIYRFKMTSPDNIDTMVQEDTSEAAILRHDLKSGTWSTVATVNDPRDESSGIVDASQWFGPGWWMLTVQARSSNNAEEIVSDELTLKREDGQLLLMKIPGS